MKKLPVKEVCFYQRQNVLKIFSVLYFNISILYENFTRKKNTHATLLHLLSENKKKHLKISK